MVQSSSTVEVEQVVDDGSLVRRLVTSPFDRVVPAASIPIPRAGQILSDIRALRVCVSFFISEVA